ncbi:MAG: alpha/beta fold hydrolase [Kiloniellales bacterium]|nr:alpha/beta fold hydrolase [Kiloniellales bacterium]
MSDGSGDSLLAHLQSPDDWDGESIVVLLHGLTGCAESSYMRNSASYFLSHGEAVVRLNLRGAGPGRILSTSLYHAGRSEDLRDALHALVPQLPKRGGTVFRLMGFSLGANILLKALAEDMAGLKVEAAVAISCPIDLKAAQVRISKPRNKLYHNYLLGLMRRNFLAGPGVSDEDRCIIHKNIKTVRDFDQFIVSRRFGFSDAEDYYEKSSAKRYLPRISHPTLLIHADDDPWIPSRIYRDFGWRGLDPEIRLIMTRGGGHVGFHGEGSSAAWHDRAAAKFFASVGERQAVAA